MFKLVTEDSQLIKKVFEAVKSITGETEIVFSEEGMRVTNIDAGRVALIDMFLSSEDVDEYKFKGESKIGLNVEDIVKILSRAGKDDKVTMFHKDNTPDLVIQLLRDETKKRKFTLRLKDISMPPIKPASLDAIKFDNSFELPPQLLQEAIKDCELFNDTISLILNNEEIKFSAYGNSGEMETILPKDFVNNFTFGSESEAVYAIRFIHSALIVSTITGVNSVKLHMKSDQPLKIEFNILGNSFVKYYIAPRIEDTEDEY